MSQQAETEFTLDTAAELAAAEPEAIRGRSPWYLAWRRLRRNYFAFFSLAIFILVVERDPVQGENVEPNLGRKRVLETSKHRGAIGSPAQAAGEAEKAEFGHRAQFRMA